MQGIGSGPDVMSHPPREQLSRVVDEAMKEHQAATLSSVI
jgi:hypothetical protein